MQEGDQNAQGPQQLRMDQNSIDGQDDLHDLHEHAQHRDHNDNDDEVDDMGNPSEWMAEPSHLDARKATLDFMRRNNYPFVMVADAEEAL